MKDEKLGIKKDKKKGGILRDVRWETRNEEDERWKKEKIGVKKYLAKTLLFVVLNNLPSANLDV